jgi:prepilin-type N-terminal cleavage/methylation domain-containing protein
MIFYKSTVTDLSDAGFSLIELSIVLIIMGLLMTGVVGGAALIRAAKYNKVGSEIKKVEQALASYYTTRNAYPDFNTPCQIISELSENGHLAMPVQDGKCVVLSSYKANVGWVIARLDSDQADLDANNSEFGEMLDSPLMILGALESDGYFSGTKFALKGSEAIDMRVKIGEDNSSEVQGKKSRVRLSIGEGGTDTGFEFTTTGTPKLTFKKEVFFKNLQGQKVKEGTSEITINGMADLKKIKTSKFNLIVKLTDISE